MNKLFCIGWQKTGTTSISVALGHLGLRISHWADYHFNETLMLEVENGQYHFSLLNKFDGMSDTPTALYFRELDLAYPGSKFVVTCRDESSWIESAENHCAQRGTGNRGDFVYAMQMAMYGVRFDRNRFLRRYRAHYKEVREYFDGRDVLYIDMFTTPDKELWTSLANFIGYEGRIPEIPFPHYNVSR